MNRKPRFDITDFDDNGRLKAPLGLVLSLLFISRHILFLLLGGLSTFIGAAGFKLSALGLPPAWLLLTDIPVLLFLLLIIRRDRLAGDGWLRRLLYRGRLPVVFLGIAQMALIVGLDYASLFEPALLPVFDFASVGVCVYYLMTSEKVRAFFAEQGG